MRIPVPDELLPADAARPGPLRRHRRRRRCPAIARIMAARGVAGHRQRRPRHARSCRRCASSGVTLPPRLRRRPPRRLARHRRRHHGRPRGQPRGASRPGAAGCGCCRARPAWPSVMAGRGVLAVAGTHGKTTTTSLLTVALLEAGRRPDVRRRRRARRDRRTTPTRAAATCSSPRPTRATAPSSSTRPHAAIVTNVEADHLDQWGTEEAYRAAFVEFLDRIDPGGLPGAAASTTPARPTSPRRPASAGCDVVAVGESERAPTCRATDLAFDGTTSAFTVVDDGAELGPGHAADPGPPLRPRRARGARASASGSASTSTALRRGLESFTGTGRRMERKGEAGGRPGLRQLRPPPAARSPATCRPPAAVAGDGPAASWPSSRTWSPAPGSSAPRWARRSARPTRSSCSTSTSPARTPTPRSPGALVADAVPLPAERVAFVPDLADVPAAARRAGPARRPGADPRRRRRHRARPARPGAAGSAPMPSRVRERPGAPTPRRVRSRRAFARRQWARRWLTWKYVARGAPPGRAAWSAGVWLVFFSSLPRGQSGRGRPAPSSCGDDRGARGGRRARRASRWPGSTSPRSSAGRGAGRRSAPPR